MHTEPAIVFREDLKGRSYVKVYINGKRYRFYNGKALGITCYPNHAKNIKDRDRALVNLCYNLKKKLEAGWHPDDNRSGQISATRNATAAECIRTLLADLMHHDLSELYKRDLSSVGYGFLAYLKEGGFADVPIERIDTALVDGFLKQFNHSATYFMNKRRTLGAIFSRLVKAKLLPANPIKESTRLRERATLHQAFTREQLRQVLRLLEDQHPKLYLCCLLMYGCLLRPHQEIRKLLRGHLSEDCTSISLAGGDNKSGRVRTVFVPSYVRDALEKHGVQMMEGDVNLFTQTRSVFNECYFNTAWSRLKTAMLRDNIVGDKHTLYSFRHSGAINMYLKTKDLYKVQQAMGHSSMTVTLTYLRSLGVVNAASPDDVPDLW